MNVKKVSMDKRGSGCRTMQVVSMCHVLGWAMRLSLRWLFAALLVPCAMAQTPEADRQREYYRELDRQREEQQRRAQEEMQRQQKSAEDARKREQESRDQSSKNIEDYRKQRAPTPSGGSSAGTGADMTAARARLLKMPPLPDARNPLLGRWRIESAGRSRNKGDMAQLMGMLNNPGGAMCETLFGAGSVTEFKPTTWSSIDSYGNDSLGPIHYRGEGKIVWAVPESKMFNFFGFEFASPDRMALVGVERCVLVRAGAAAASATNAPPGAARMGVSGPPARSTGADARVVDGAGFRCGDGGLYHVTNCGGDATCNVEELHRPLPASHFYVSSRKPRAEIAARVQTCESGGFRFAPDGKPIFIK